MFKVVKIMEFCYGHRLLDYDGKCANLHGHNGLVEIEIKTNKLDARGLVVDFGEIKAIVKKFLDENLDHKMILSSADPFVEILRAQKEPMYVMKENPSAENIAKLIFDYAREKGLPVNEVRLWETRSSCASYSL